jgi:hypothetical protein
MCKQLHKLALAALLVFTGCLARPARADDKAAGKLRVVIIDGQNNHAWNVTTPHLKKVLESCGRFTVSVSTTPKTDGKKPDPSITPVPFPPDLDQFDVVLSNYNSGDLWPVGFRTALEDHLKNGKVGLVIVHAANNAFPGSWKEYDRMIGMGWRGNQYGDRLTLDASGKEVRVPKGEGIGASHGDRVPFVVTLRDTEHPITKGLPREWLHARDELYSGMRGPIENVHLLATAFDDKKHRGRGEIEPILWTVGYGQGRVFHTVMGHDLEAMRCIGFITTLQRGSEWAATGAVTLPVPEAFPTAEQGRSLPAP